VLKAEGDLAGARAAYERALRIDEKSFGPDHPNVARDVNNLGFVLVDLGDLAGARAAFARALGICERVLGLDHPRTRTVRANLGSLGGG
jgi:tetratricopeptide (TPR) repeat protein